MSRHLTFLGRAAPLLRGCATGLLWGCATAFLWGCATGVEGNDDDGGGGSSPSQTFSHRAPIEIADAPEGIAVSLSFAHFGLVADEKSQSDGDDVRIFYDAGDGAIELDRFLDPASAWNANDTKLWFRTQPGTGTYHLYYGEPEAADPPADPTNVFLLYESFDAPMVDEGWSYEAVGAGVTDDFTPAEGQLEIRGQGGDIPVVAMPGTDSMVFFYRELSGDFSMQVTIADADSGNGATAKLGGVMMRESLDADAVFAAVLVGNAASMQPRSFLNVQRTTAADPAVTSTPAPAAADFPYHVRLTRAAGLTTLEYSPDGLTYLNVGSPITLGLTDPVLVGIPYSNASGDLGSIFLDSVRVRRLTLPEPTVSLGEEEEL